MSGLIVGAVVFACGALVCVGVGTVAVVSMTFNDEIPSPSGLLGKAYAIGLVGMFVGLAIVIFSATAIGIGLVDAGP